jgi:hypothetical protein
MACPSITYGTPLYRPNVTTTFEGKPVLVQDTHISNETGHYYKIIIEGIITDEPTTAVTERITYDNNRERNTDPY